jgi:type 1 fimbria pilin
MVVVVVAALLIASYSASGRNGKLTYQIETIANKCTFDVSPEQEISAAGKTIIVVMPIQTPTPCYEIEGTVSSTGNDIRVDLRTVKKGDVCVECVGVVTARVTISNLADGTYNVQVNTPDKSIISTVNVE